MPSAANLGVRKGQNGKKYASGTLAAGSGADVDVVTGLGVVDHGGVSMDAPPNMGHLFSTATISSAPAPGSLRIRSYKPTATGNVTPIPVTTTVAVNWWAVGD